MHCTRMNRPAFTLLEMALILILVGVVLGTALPRLLSDITTDKARNSKNDVIEARDELVGYAIVKGRLPTPDTSGTVPAVPSQIKARSDAWERGLTFILPNTNATGGTLDGTDICDLGSTDMTVSRPGGSTEQVAFVVASRGLNSLSDLRITDPAPGNPVAQSREVGALSFGADSLVNGGEQFDDIMEFVTLDYLKSRIDCSSSGPGSNDSIDFSDIGNDFPAPTGAGTASDNGIITVDSGSQNILVLNTNAGTGSSGNNPEGGCIYYRGSAGTCTTDDSGQGGVCQLGNGFRAFFHYAFTHSPDGGMVFTIPAVKLDSVANSGDNDNVDTLCGAYQNEAYIGYAGTSGTSNVIRDPKIGIEFDLSRDGTLNDPGSGGASGRNHLAVVFFGTAGDPLDDNTHNTGSPLNPVTSNALYDSGSNGWLEGFGDFRMELEVVDAATGHIKIRAWADCTSSTACSDLSNDMSVLAPTATPTLNYEVTDPAFVSAVAGDPFYLHRVGWSFVFGSQNESVTLSNFQLTWR